MQASYRTPTAIVAQLRERSLLTTTNRPPLSWTLFTNSTRSLRLKSESLVNCCRDKSHSRALRSTSGSTLPGSGRTGSASIKVDDAFARKT